jgi:hypothetical protein
MSIDLKFTMPLLTSQEKVLAILPKISGWASAFFSTFTFVIVFRDRSKRQKVYHRLVLGMACADISSSLWLSLSTWPIPRETGILWAVGTTQSCTAQGFFTQLGISSPLYNVSLSLYYVLAVRFNWKEERLRKVEPILHLGPWLWALGTSTAGVPLQIFNSANLWCWIADYPGRNMETNKYRWAFFYGPLWTTLIVVSINLFLLFQYVWAVTRKSEQHIFQHKHSQALSPLSSHQQQPPPQQQQQQKRRTSIDKGLSPLDSAVSEEFDRASAAVSGSEQDHNFHHSQISDEQEVDDDHEDQFYYDQGFISSWRDGFVYSRRDDSTLSPQKQEAKLKTPQQPLTLLPIHHDPSVIEEGDENGLSKTDSKPLAMENDNLFSRNCHLPMRLQMAENSQPVNTTSMMESSNRSSTTPDDKIIQPDTYCSSNATNHRPPSIRMDALASYSSLPRRGSSSRSSLFFNAASSRFSSLFLLGNATPGNDIMSPDRANQHEDIANNTLLNSSRNFLLLRQQQDQSRRQRNQRQQQRMTQYAKRRRHVAHQCLRYALAFYWTWIPISIIRILQTIGKPFNIGQPRYFMLFVLAALNTPMQGLPNFIVYLYPMVLKAKQQLENEQRQEKRRQQNQQQHQQHQHIKSNILEWIRISLTPSASAGAEPHATVAAKNNDKYSDSPEMNAAEEKTSHVAASCASVLEETPSLLSIRQISSSSVIDEA